MYLKCMDNTCTVRYISNYVNTTSLLAYKSCVSIGISLLAAFFTRPGQSSFARFLVISFHKSNKRNAFLTGSSSMSSIALTWCLETIGWVWSGHEKRYLVGCRSDPLSGWYSHVAFFLKSLHLIARGSGLPFPRSGMKSEDRLIFLYQVEWQWDALTYTQTQIRFTTPLHCAVWLQYRSVTCISQYVLIAKARMMHCHETILGVCFKACGLVSWQQSGHVPLFQLQNTANQLFSII